MKAFFLTLINLFLILSLHAQLPVGVDTISVRENGSLLKLPWANGLNWANFSNTDLNFDGVKDLVAFDKLNQFGVGRFRCFIKTGTQGQTTYSYSPLLTYSFPQAVNWATFVDYNCDGKEDLFCSTTGGIMVYKNTSTISSGISFSLASSLLYTHGYSMYYNLYASPVGLPGLTDIDNDGDIDVLTFSSQGVYLEYHQNMSMEAYGDCHSLDTFNLNTECWGKIIESNCSVAMSQTCAQRPWPDYHPELQTSMHAGSCLTCIDYDNDFDKDLLMGDISCNNIQFLLNGGTTANAIVTDTTKLYPNYPNKNSTQQIKISNFPCTYNVDVDGDGKKDLIATPNTPGSENANSVWYYRNTSVTNTVNFQFVKNNFLQDQMIEVGQNSYPVIFDYNSDGKKDLLVGTFGYFNSNSLKAQLALYENIGTATQPSYSLVTKDYASISTQSLNFAIPTAGDVDGDGDVDILIGTSNGKIHWLKNTAGPGNVCAFTFITNPFNILTYSAVAAVQLFDMNKDGKPDLMIGGKNGRIQYYKNTGTTTAPAFTLVTNTFGLVNVKGDPTMYGTDGYASPFFYDEPSGTKLLAGSVSGQLFYYSIPSLTADTCVAALINNSTNNLNEGAQSTVCYEDVNGDGKRDLFIGNAGGGLSYFSSTSPYVSINELRDDRDALVTIYPVPAQQQLNIQVTKIEAQKVTVIIHDVLGKEVAQYRFTSNRSVVNLDGISNGVYFVKVIVGSNSGEFIVTKKIIKN